MTPKQQRFVEEYLVDLNATAAARRAGYSVHTAEQQGPRLLDNVGIRAAIDAALTARSLRTELTQDWVVAQLRQESLDRGEGSSHSARVRALELLGKHQGMFADRHVHSGAIGLQYLEGVSREEVLGTRNGTAH